ncbi:hypothetical protein HK104_003618, partial [Borealophlyctis nickersoniae]
MANMEDWDCVEVSLEEMMSGGASMAAGEAMDCEDSGEAGEWECEEEVLPGGSEGDFTCEEQNGAFP